MLICSIFIFIEFELFSVFWPRGMAYRILVPRPGIEPAPPAVEARSLNHWTAREVPNLNYFLTALLISSLTHRLFRNVLLNFQIFWDI